MRFMVQGRQPADLTDDQRRRLYAAMDVFYGDIPDGVTLECDYIRADKLGSYSVLSLPDRATLDRILAPFDGLVDVEVVELVAGEEP